MNNTGAGQPGQPGQANAANGTKPPQPLRKVPPQVLRRKPRADPLVARKKPQQRPKDAPKQSLLSSKKVTDVATLVLPSEARTVKVVNPEEEAKKLADFDKRRMQNGGWTDPAPETGYQDFPVITTKRALREGIRHHVMRFTKAGKGDDQDQDIDPTNPDEFTRPVSLHRRDPRQPAPGRIAKEEKTPDPAAASATAEEKDAERAAQQKAEREAQRAMDMAQIAPVVSKDAASGKKVVQPQKKEKQYQLYFPKNSAQQKKEAEIRYEEALPWHLEDADGKNVWVGTYVSALSEANVALVIDGSAFRMIPLEKYYRFTPKPPFQAYSIDQAEEIMAKKMAAGRWAMRDTEKKMQEEELLQTRRAIGGRARVKLESSTFRAAPRSEKVEHDDIDMEGDEFQDDDENVGLEPENDEDSKEARERQRRNHLGANLFGDADEREVEKEEQESKMARKTGQLGKQLRKALAKREDHLEYLEYDDEDTNSDKEDFELELSSDDDDEEEKNEDKDDEKTKVEAKDKDSKLPPVANPPPKGNTTPLKAGKTADGLKKGKSLKRPGSPNLSESSGNESSRKKAKKLTTLSVRPSRSTTPLPGQQRPGKAAAGVGKGGGGALSDGEGTAGETSDAAAGGAKRRIKIVTASSRQTPAGSRAGSPNPTVAAGAAAGTAASARAGSPASRAGSPGAASGSGLVGAAEIVATLQQFKEGVKIRELLEQFRGRIGDGPGQMNKLDWIRLVKENSVYGEDKRLRAKVASDA